MLTVLQWNLNLSVSAKSTWQMPSSSKMVIMTEFANWNGIILYIYFYLYFAPQSTRWKVIFLYRKPFWVCTESSLTRKNLYNGFLPPHSFSLRTARHTIYTTTYGGLCCPFFLISQVSRSNILVGTGTLPYSFLFTSKLVFLTSHFFPLHLRSSVPRPLSFSLHFSNFNTHCKFYPNTWWDPDFYHPNNHNSFHPWWNSFFSHHQLFFTFILNLILSHIGPCPLLLI